MDYGNTTEITQHALNLSGFQNVEVGHYTEEEEEEEEEEVSKLVSKLVFHAIIIWKKK